MAKYRNIFLNNILKKIKHSEYGLLRREVQTHVQHLAEWEFLSQQFKGNNMC